MTNARKTKSLVKTSSPTTDPGKAESTGGSVTTASPLFERGQLLKEYDLEMPVTIGDYTYPLELWLGNVNDRIIAEAVGLTRYTIIGIRKKHGIDKCINCAFNHKTNEKLKSLTRTITCSVINKHLTYGRPSDLDSHLATLKKTRRIQSLQSQQSF